MYLRIYLCLRNGQVNTSPNRAACSCMLKLQYARFAHEHPLVARGVTTAVAMSRFKARPQDWRKSIETLENVSTESQAGFYGSGVEVSICIYGRPTVLKLQ